MILYTKEFRTALSDAAKCAASKGVFNIIMFTGTEIRAGDGELFVSIPYETDFKCCIAPTTLLSVLAGVTSDTVKVECDGEKLEVSFGGTSSRILCSNTDVTEQVLSPVPKIPEGGVREVQVDSDVFAAVSAVSVRYPSKDPSRSILNAINVAPRNGKLYMNATDGRRLCTFPIGDAIEGEGFNVFPRIFTILARVPVKHMVIYENYVEFVCVAGYRYLAQQMLGVYPNVQRVIPEVNKGEHAAVPFPSTIVDTLKKAALFSETITLCIEKGHCVLTASTADVGEFKTTFAIEHAGDVTTSFNAGLLIEMLSATTEVYLSASAPAMGRYLDGCIVLMPLRQG